MKCFYHSADFDGKCSGAIVRSLWDCELIGINYGEPFPWERIERGETVVMVDFSLQPFEEMERLSSLAYFVWIDHHKSAIEEAARRGFVASGAQVLEIGRAGCELTWEHFMGTPPPRGVHLLGRYDVWEYHNHPGALEFQYGLRNERETGPENQELWRGLFEDEGQVEEIIRRGTLLLAYEQAQNKRYAKSCAFETELDGLRCVAVNKALTNSLLFEAVYDPGRHDAMLAFARRPGKWTVSLYTDKPGVDVSAVCKARGGGGHAGAAGFQCEVLPFLMGVPDAG